MSFRTTQSNWLKEASKRVYNGNGKRPTTLLDVQFTDCQDGWNCVVVQDPDLVVRFLFEELVTKPGTPMSNSQYRGLRKLLVAVCELAVRKEAAGSVLRGHRELMDALAANMPDLNAELREHEEALRRAALDPVAAIA